MKHIKQFLMACLLVVLATQSLYAGNRRPLEKCFPKNAKNEVYYIPQFSDFTEISEAEQFYLKRVLRQAKENNIKAVIFELDTPGGRVDIALRYISIFDKSPVPVIAYITSKGCSAGMIIAIGATRVAIHPDGVIGDAMPIIPGPHGIKPIVYKPRKKKEEKKEQKPTKKPGKNKKNKSTAEKKNKKDVAKKVSPSVNKLIKKIEKLEREKKSTSSSEQQRLANQKFLSFFFETLKVLAEKNDRPVRVIRAMADPYQELTKERDGIEHEVELNPSPLTLTAREAKRLKVVDYLARNKEELLEKLNLGNCKLTIIEKQPYEQIGQFLAGKIMSALLLALGIIGLYVEIRTPGFGVPGILGICCLALFFAGHILVGDSSYGTPILFFIGLVLLLVEIFVIPGFGIVGILGISCILFSLFMAIGFKNLEEATYVIATALASALAVMIFLTTYVLPKSTLFRRMTLTGQQNKEDGYLAHEQLDETLVGEKGITITPLRPTGIAKIKGKRMDVITSGEFIAAKTDVTVTSVNGLQIEVEETNEESLT